MREMYPNLMYHLMNVLSLSLNPILSFLIIFCTNGEKNIKAANESWILVWLCVFWFSSMSCMMINLHCRLNVETLKRLNDFFYFTSVVMNSFSVGEANILHAMCWFPAKISHSPIPQETSLFFSASDNQIKVLSDLIDVVDCLSKMFNAEFEMIGFPYLLLTKSSISCEIVVIPSPYFLALFTNP